MCIRQLEPWVLMSISAYYGTLTIIKLVLSFDFGTLLSWSALKDAWFGNFWVFMGPQSKKGAEQNVVPLLDGRIRKGRVLAEDASQPIKGVVLEIGAGSGMWMDVVSKAVQHASTQSGTTIYGVEPNPISAAALKRRAHDMGLDGVYEVVPVGIEDLENESAWGGRIAPGTVDCIVTIQCLCSIPEPEKNIALLYKYLKDGGRWYVYEHIKNDHGLVIPLFQKFTNIFWPHFLGGCQLCRRTGETLLNVGSWSDVNLAPLDGETSWDIIPHVIGTLTK
ncbi:S-adenosyl-L-methionine-dependent methyltransferase [Dactylonectria macrodidyma]|uniref:S-adenosyl-L-methionine-dependent methyltransferase n=1 Tax=Dactylonectria macrodidyma TaxID=307937 RepID=A0A9P9DDZ5_9HYPO|nr:S-adenosyl-L-methionine-dependent methyltransferase [Dactylonectria macrodidyma]